MGIGRMEEVFICRSRKNEIFILLSWFLLYVVGIYEGDDFTEKS